MPPQNSILFVNKTAQSKSLTRSEGTERSNIFAHVQNLPTTPSGEFRVTGWSVSTSSNYLLNEPLNLPPDDDDDESGNRHRQMRRKQTNKKNPASDRARRASPFVRSAPRSSSLSSAQLDPFNCAAVFMDTLTSNAFKFFCYTYVEEMFTVKSWAQMNLQCHLYYASQSPELTYAITSTAADIMYARGADPKYRYYAMRLKGQTIHHLQQRIDDINATHIPSVGTVRTVLGLLYNEARRGDLDSARVHYIALRNMVETMVDVATVPLSIRILLADTSSFCSAMLAERPLQVDIFGRKDNEGAKLLLDEIQDRLTINLGIVSGKTLMLFFTYSNRKLIGPRLLSVIRELRGIENTKGSWSCAGEFPAHQELQKWYSLKREVHYKLLFMPSEPGHLTPEQQAVRITLCLCCDLEMSPKGPPALFYQSMTEQIRSHLEQTDLSSMWSSSSDLLLWVVAVAIYSTPEDEQRSWLIEQARKLKRVLNIESLQGLEEILLQFLRARKQGADSTQVLWNEMQAGIK